MATLVLSGCGASAQAASVTHKPTPVAVAPAKFTAETAAKFAEITGGKALHTETHWACNQPMHISVAAPDAFAEQAYKSLAYTVAYLQGLGYDAGIVAPTAYESDMTDQPHAGTVLVVVAPYHQDQPTMGDSTGYADFDNGAVTRSAVVFLDASRQGLNPDIILHEFGHVLGLDHRHVGSVMDESWAANSGHFDADETATVTCL
jgi:hypothetical protein